MTTAMAGVLWDAALMADDDFLRALGEVTAEASALEYAVAFLVTCARGQSESALPDILKRIGGARSELDRLSKDVASAGTDPALHSSLLALHRRMSLALWERNRLVHAVEVLKLSSEVTGYELGLWHPKTDTNLHIELNDLENLIAELRGIAGSAMRLTHTAHAWASPQNP